MKLLYSRGEHIRFLIHVWIMRSEQGGSIIERIYRNDGTKMISNILRNFSNAFKSTIFYFKNRT
jgi:hypothetical protein